MTFTNNGILCFKHIFAMIYGTKHVLKRLRCKLNVMLLCEYDLMKCAST